MRICSSVGSAGGGGGGGGGDGGGAADASWVVSSRTVTSGEDVVFCARSNAVAVKARRPLKVNIIVAKNSQRRR